MFSSNLKKSSQKQKIRYKNEYKWYEVDSQKEEPQVEYLSK